MTLTQFCIAFAAVVLAFGTLADKLAEKPIPAWLTRVLGIEDEEEEHGN